MATIQIYGYVYEQDTYRPMVGLYVEIYGSGMAPYNQQFWMGGGKVDEDGSFNIFLREDTPTPQFPLTLVVFYGDHVIHTQNLDYSGASILVPTQHYNFYYYYYYGNNGDGIDLTHERNENLFFTIYGRLTNKVGAPVPYQRINALIKEFRINSIICRAETDGSGYYSMKIAYVSLGSARILMLQTDIGGIQNVSSPNISEFPVKQEVNLQVDYTGIYDNDFAQLYYYISQFVYEYYFPTITTTGEDRETFYLARKANRDEASVIAFVRSYVYADEAGWPANQIYAQFVYAILKAGITDDRNAIYGLSEEQLRQIWTDAAEQGLISPDCIYSIEGFIPLFRQILADTTLDVIIEEEGITWRDFFSGTAYFEQMIEYTYFLAAYQGDDVAQFWIDAADMYGPYYASQMQMALQLASFTGYQPRMSDTIWSLIGWSWTDLSDVARLSSSDWYNLISATGGTLVIPKIILDNAPDPLNEYARRLRAISQNSYPGIALATYLDGPDGPLLIPDTATRGQVTSFLNANPKFDMRTDDIYDIEDPETLLELSFVYDVATVKEALVPFQTLSRITNANVDGLVALKLDGIDSATAITGMSQAQFVDQYSTALGSGSSAQQAYMTAAKMNQISLQTATNLSAVVNSPNWVWLTLTPKPDPVANPDLATLFGSLEQCGCSECMSVYSAGAYYVDVLNFIKKFGTGDNSPWVELIRRRPDLQYIDISCKNTNTALPYVDLVNERLEVLILEHLNPEPPIPPVYEIPNSYQTIGTATDLAAYPEHVKRLAPTDTYADVTSYEIVYNTVLAEAVFPLILPFSLPLEEARVYLEHLGYPRLRLMELFRPYNVSALPDTDITWYNYYTESAGMMKRTADIITRNNGGSTYQYYGFSGTTVDNFLSPTDSSVTLTGNWESLLRGDLTGANAGGLDVLLYLLGISYKELQRLLITDFLNKRISGVRPVSIVARSGMPLDTCVMRELCLEINGITSEDFFDKLHRFVRLWRGTGLDIYELDILLRAFSASDITNTGSYPLYQNLMRVVHLSRQLNIPIERFVTWWTLIDTQHYLNYNSDRWEELPSMYDRLFRNKNVSNPPDPAFDNLSSNMYAGHTAVIIAACGITEEDLNLLMSADVLNIPATDYMSLSGLTRIFGVAAVCNALKIKVIDFVRFCKLNAIEYGIVWDTPTTQQVSGRLDQLEKLVNRAGDLGSSGFSLNDVRYLLLNKDEYELYTPEEKIIQPFYESMRDELKKVYVDTAGLDPVHDQDKIKALKDVLRNVIIQRFAAQLSMGAETVLYLLSELFEIGYDHSGAADYTNVPVLDALIDINFIASDYPLSKEGIGNVMPPLPLPPPPPPPYWPFVNLRDLYPLYYRMRKMALLFTKSGIRYAELRKLQENYAVLQVMDLRNYPYASTEATAEIPFEMLMRYLRWVRVRRQLSVTEENFAQLIEISAGGIKSSWIDIVARITQWNSTQLTELAGATGTTAAAGLLGVAYPDDFRDPLLLLRMADIVSVSGIIGLVPTQIKAVLLSSLVMADARKVRMAARSKYDEGAWLKVAKPLQDPLRERQRNALVAYVLSKPKPQVPQPPPPLPPVPPVNTKIWRTENDLYAWLLVDVEMQPCTMTSRIRLGLSSLQMFMGRVIMNLEYVNGDNTQLVELIPAAVEQWEAWRKWYSIWEANRKIFLYPENWIEPELRDNKTPYFKELETQLLQDELTNDSAANAYRDYLEKLDKVDRLEPVAAYHEVDAAYGIDIVHAVSRSYEAPPVYYYRKFTDGEWTAWEKMDIEPQSDHLTLIVWNRRVYVFWLTFMEQQVEDGDASAFIGFIKGNQDMKKSDRMENYIQYWLRRYMKWDIIDIANQLEAGRMTIEAAKNMVSRGWHIRVGWSEYKDGKWAPGKTGNDVMQMYPWRVILNEKAQNSLSSSGDASDRRETKFAVLTEMLRKGRDLSVNELFKNRLYLYPKITDSNELVLSVMSPYAFNELIIGLHAFIIPYSGAEPRIVRDTGYGFKMMSPSNTVLNKMKFLKTSYAPADWLSVDRYSRQTGQDFFIYPTHSITARNYADHERSSSQFILRQTPFGQYKITAKANPEPSENVETNITRNHFFFDDDRHLFFVRRKDASPSLLTAGLIRDAQQVSIATTAVSYQQNYVVPAMQTQGTTTIPATFSINNSLTVSFQDNNPVYYFQTFYHPQVNNFIKALNKDGLDGLLRLDVQVKTDTMNFEQHYDPSAIVYRSPGTYPYPTDIVDFAYDEAYSIYNWELFYHIPMIIAQRLSDNQQFEAAQKWFHYIFNPTSNTNDLNQVSPSKQRFWKCRPFYEEAGKQILTLRDLMNDINKYSEQVTVWEKKPFNPHVIARMRILAYMKSTVMKYLDNLIAWGDQLFRRDTVESLNEATQLYILASNILGQRPPSVPARGIADIYSFSQLSSQGLDRFSNAKVKIESFVDPNAFPQGRGNGEPPRMLYFCLPQNDKLMGYWDTVADRLFKIRNCMNIEGVVRQLPLFDPPIDPAMLVRAAASGVDINSVLNEVAGIGMPYYRFSYTLQRANEICGDIKALGGALLSALEKKDAETLALIRAGHETRVLEGMKTIRQAQITEAEQAITALKKTREVTEVRLQYYSSRPFMIGGEQKHLEALQTAMIMQAIQVGMGGTAAILAIIPNAHLQAVASGMSIGGNNFAKAMTAASSALGVGALINNTKATMAVTKAGYERRRDDWNFQADSARKELEQIDQQILGAEIRLDIAQKELANVELQIENSKEVDAYMRSKYTNEELYSWMISQISSVYFQSYQLAFDVAKKAEMCLRKELPFALGKMPAEGFIKFGYWDSLRKGLLSGEKMQYDLRKMETFYMSENKRELELTKHISLAFLDPEKLLQLKTTGVCSDLKILEELFDLDYPGQHLRRIKSVSISIPCVAGPYTTVSCKLSQISSKYRKLTTLLSGKYEEDGNNDPRFEYLTGVGDSIATSTAQNDSGVFELNFRDERYLPFEGSGAISSWTLTMSDRHHLFDYDTIQDVILHIKYTAQDSGSLAVPAKDHLDDLFNSAENFPRLFSLKYEFPDAWAAAFEQEVAVPGPPPGQARPLVIPLSRILYPEYARHKKIDISQLDFILRPGFAVSSQVHFYVRINGTGEHVELAPANYTNSRTVSITLPDDMDAQDINLAFYKRPQDSPVTFVPVELSDVEDLFMITSYKLSPL